ncbi:uncharacterized protein LOC141850356 [Brevipalpus obovatus]|uniref:uncharacterized protein LOC141850356 n=1 Tax=Brevipalpus obovatus TaxID=246614 RepID=UPI003D9F6F10
MGTLDSYVFNCSYKMFSHPSKKTKYIIGLCLVLFLLLSETSARYNCLGVCASSDPASCRRCSHREPMRFGKRSNQQQQPQHPSISSESDSSPSDGPSNPIHSLGDILFFDGRSYREAKLTPKEIIFTRIPESVAAALSSDSSSSESR